MRFYLSLAALALLTGCGGDKDAAGSSAGTQANASVAPVSGNSMEKRGNVVVPPTPAPTPSPSRLAGAEFPQSFQGRWALVPNDCEPGRADAKGLMVVTADRVSFYESRATPMRIAAITPARLIADLSFTGEGQAWTKQTHFTLTRDGNRLVREEADPALSLEYTRCPGAKMERP